MVTVGVRAWLPEHRWEQLDVNKLAGGRRRVIKPPIRSKEITVLGHPSPTLAAPLQASESEKSMFASATSGVKTVRTAESLKL